MRQQRDNSKAGLHLRKIVLATAATLSTAGSVQAMELDVGSPDVKLRWDNTLRYTVAQRVGARNPIIASTPNMDEGTYLFDKGAIVSNRLDLLTELDFVHQKDKGFRVSAAGWVDKAYDGMGKSNPAIANPSYVNNTFSPFVQRYYKGPSGEILDAFVFANFDLGNTPVKVKLGRHAVAWGEALFLGGAMHSVQYAQVPLDLQKGFAMPGVEAKELFRPLNQLSMQAQVSDTVSVAAQYMLQWEPYRYPEGGTFLGPVDFAFNGPDRAVVTNAGAILVGAVRGNAYEPRNSGEFGISARWSPAALDGTLGFYYRQYADKMPQALMTVATLHPVLRVPLINFPGTPASTYNLIYADKIDLFGVSLAKNIGGVSVGAELSYRRNTPLTSKTLGIALGAPAQGETNGPRGDTYHALVNLMGVVAKTGLFDAATWAGELQWNRWDKVRTGANNFFAVGQAGCTNLGNVTLDSYAGCATKDYVGVSLAFTPSWYQVMSGVDLSMPMTYAVGLKGNSSVTFGGNEGLGSFSLGLGADIFQKYRIDLKYNGYFGDITPGSATGAAGTVQRVTGCPAGATCVAAQNGFTSLLQDRDFVSLTFKTSF